MKLYPINVIDFQDMFPTERACEEYLFIIRWPEGFICPNCRHGDAWKLGSGLLRCANCKRDVSLIAGSVFQGSHLPLRLWFQAMWYVVCQKQGVSALALKSILNVGSYKTAWEWLHKLRRAMVRPGRDRLSGLVEVDEIFVGGERHKFEGRSQQGKTLVLVAAEDKGRRGVGRIRMRIIPDATASSLRAAVHAMVEPDSIVRTDGWTGYKPERWGYRHRQIGRRSLNPGDDPTPLVHRVSSLLKRWLLNTHQGGVQRTHLPYYLDEFVFRFNRRTSRSRGLLFYRLVQQALMVNPVPAAQLKASP